MNYKTFGLLNQYSDVIHGFTYKNGGIVELPFGNQHMGLLSFHFQDEAWENIKHLIQTLDTDLKPKNLVFTEQIHQDHLINFESTDYKKTVKDGYDIYIIKSTDGVFTTQTETLLMTFYADCTPIFFYDPILKVIGMVHSGWKGTKLKIASQGILFMTKTYGSKISDLKVVIGPAASACCYEVDQLVYEQFLDYPHCFKQSREGHYLMDMKRIIHDDLIQTGLLDSQIEVSEECTICKSEAYFSHRRDQGNTGRMAAFMLISGD